MRKLLLLSTAFLFSAGCNQSNDDAPPTQTANNATQKEVMKPFEQRPEAKTIKVQAKVQDLQVARIQSGDIIEFLSRLKSPAQRFTIIGGEDSEITGERGTTIAINAKSFVDANGNEVTQPLEVELRELYTLPDMLRENLPSTTNGTLLQSKGTICITAFYKGEELKLKSGEMIDVSFPFALGEKDGYHFYYGEEVNERVVNWNSAEEEGEVSTGALRHKKITAPEFSYLQMELKEYLQQYVQYPEDARRNELSARIEVSFRIDRTGGVSEVIAGTTYKTFKDEINRVLLGMPVWTPAMYNNHNIASGMKVTIDFNLRRKNQVMIEMNEKDMVVYVPLKNKEHALSIKNAGTKNMYSCSFGSTGWINCDKMVSDKSQRADLIVRSDANTDVRVIWNNNIISTADNYVGYSRFDDIPVNSEVTVLSIKYENEQAYYCIQPLKLQKQNVVTPVWMKADEKELVKAFAGLRNKSKIA